MDSNLQVYSDWRFHSSTSNERLRVGHIVEIFDGISTSLSNSSVIIINDTAPDSRYNDFQERPERGLGLRILCSFRARLEANQ
ncbi:uncharacterized protein QC761_0015120 [Podospora bellae-mahoneyi]|uniref:Uncharacterized protein n=1 Tax=Podospora bellae-mahoneyi TaxID=2093777 RepID=A0ABR0FZD7_9PEZI|nr:hypothetical protein QC761_0015120 [Podospora bellae-mahoneyi]